MKERKNYEGIKNVQKHQEHVEANFKKKLIKIKKFKIS